MDLKKISVIISREFVTRVKKKSFIITTIVTPILFVALMFIPSLVMLYSEDTGEVKKVMIVDESGCLENAFEGREEIDGYKFIVQEYFTIKEARSMFDSLGVYALVGVSPMDENGNVTAVSYSRSKVNVDFQRLVTENISKVFRDLKLSKYDIENVDDLLSDARYDVPLKTITIDDEGKDKVDIVEIYMAISYVATFLIYIFIFSFGSMVMRGVIEEKTNRIVEVIISSVRPVELMLGKIIGVASVAITQCCIWVVFIGIIVFGVKSFIGFDQVQEVLAAQQAAGTDQVVGMESLSSIQQELAGDPEMMEIIGMIGDINFGFIFLSFVLYFILGYLLYSSMFAAIGSAVENETDTNQFMMPVTIPLIVGLVMMMHTFNYPDSSLSFWGSIIPFTSPMVMMARVPFGVPMWEYALSLGLLAVTFLGITWLSAKIYRTGILMYGKKPSWKDLWKWIKY